MLYDAHTVAYCVTDFAAASRCPVQPPNLPSAKKFQSRSKAKEKQQGQSETVGSERIKQGLKAVVCRLPPNHPEQIFWQSMQTWVTNEAVILKELYPSKVKKK